MGHVTFAGLPLLTAAGRVMAPRPASEQLVDAAREFLAGATGRVVDVGTGSGAIAIAIAAASPRAEVWATDTSRCAVALARANVRRHHLGNRIFVRHGDLLEQVPDPIDLIVANLPYLPAAAAHKYPELAGEPASAVFAGGDGLSPYRRLLDAADERLTDDGLLIFQLHRRVVIASRAELPVVGAALDRVTAEPTLLPGLVGRPVGAAA